MHRSHMPDGHQLSQELGAASNWLSAVGLGDGVPPDVPVDKAAALAELCSNFDAVYKRAARSDAGASELLADAAIIRNLERATRERFELDIEVLRRKWAERLLRDTAAQDWIQEIVDVAVDGFALYRDLYDKFLKLAAERRAAAGEILRARPVAGEIDYAELSREHMARYPKIRAALAK